MPDAGTGTIDVGSPGASSSPLANPRVLLVIGGSVLLAVVFLLVRRSSSTPEATSSDVAGPNAALAIGSLESRLKEGTGRLEELIAGQGTSLSGQLGGLSGQLGSLGDALGDIGSMQLSLGQRDLLEQHQIRTQIQALTDPANAQWYQAEYYRWARDELGVPLPEDVEEFVQQYWR